MYSDIITLHYDIIVLDQLPSQMVYPIYDIAYDTLFLRLSFRNCLQKFGLFETTQDFLYLRSIQLLLSKTLLDLVFLLVFYDSLSSRVSWRSMPAWRACSATQRRSFSILRKVSTSPLQQINLAAHSQLFPR